MTALMLNVLHACSTCRDPGVRQGSSGYFHARESDGQLLRKSRGDADHRRARDIVVNHSDCSSRAEPVQGPLAPENMNGPLLPNSPTIAPTPIERKNRDATY